MSFPTDFDNFVNDFIYPHENAYAPGHDGDPNFVITEDVPGDSGGLTKYGVDASSHPGVDIAGLTASSAELIYWQDMCAGQSQRLPGRLTYYHFDCEVNLGSLAAIKILQ